MEEASRFLAYGVLAKDSSIKDVLMWSGSGLPVIAFGTVSITMRGL
jgi:hypothetical protein